MSFLASEDLSSKSTGLLLTTFLVVFYIKQSFQDQKELWELLVAKAERWIATLLHDEQLKKQMCEAIELGWKRRVGN